MTLDELFPRSIYPLRARCFLPYPDSKEENLEVRVYYRKPLSGNFGHGVAVLAAGEADGLVKATLLADCKVINYFFDPRDPSTEERSEVALRKYIAARGDLEDPYANLLDDALALYSLAFDEDFRKKDLQWEMF